ncbi:alpha/beta fold hydrolase [Enterococcus bulliens]
MKRSKTLLLEDGSTLAYRIYGHGFPLILLHGNGNTGAYFERQVPTFAKYFQVIVLDSRGHGASTNVAKHISYRLMAHDVKRLFEVEHLQSAHLLGFSDGANIAMAFASEYPDCVAKLVLNAGNIEVHGMRLVIEWLTYIEYFSVWLLGRFIPYFKAKTPIIRLMIQDTEITKTDLAHITAKTLVIVGKKDVIKVEHSFAIASAIPNSRFVLVANHGHRLARTSPALFNHEVLNFLRG